MGSADHVWSDGERVKATPLGLAAALAAGIIRSTNLLHSRFEEQGFRRANPKRFSSEACVLECVIFEWFLRDVVVSVELGRHMRAVRRALARRLVIDLERSGLSPAALMDFDRLHRVRFEEYGKALDASSSLQTLGSLAWLRISGEERPSDQMTMFLAVRATAELRALRGLGKKYSLVTIPPRPRPPLGSSE